MPLKQYTGPVIGPILDRIQEELGPDAEVLNVEQRRAPGGRTILLVTAGDPESIAAAVRDGRRPSTMAGTAAPAAAPAPPLVSRSAEREDPRLAGRQDPPPQALARRGAVDVLAIVGPTGAGKTTTVAKLAGHARIFGGRAIGLLSLDTFRVGALDQLAQYAELFARPMAVAYEPADLPRALAELKGCDVILVDCPGRGPKMQRDAELVRVMLQALQPQETHLAIPVGLRADLVARTIAAHRPLGVTHLLATKVDEAPQDWSVFDAAVEANLPMRWLADGQRVPHDVRAAEGRLQSARQSQRTPGAREAVA
ncbi:MAG: hypothetical protein NW201_00280 [Gemmatimonadales bacterium]|nr:hypothetical protein [Gemmatimonadales bacterium]